MKTIDCDKQILNLEDQPIIVGPEATVIGRALANIIIAVKEKKFDPFKGHSMPGSGVRC